MYFVSRVQETVVTKEISAMLQRTVIAWTNGKTRAEFILFLNWPATASFPAEGLQDVHLEYARKKLKVYFLSRKTKNIIIKV